MNGEKNKHLLREDEKHIELGQSRRGSLGECWQIQAALTRFRKTSLISVTLTPSFYQHQQNLKQSNDFVLPQSSFWPECLV